MIPKEKLIAIETLCGYEKYPDYFVCETGKVYSKKSIRKSPQISDSLINRVKELSNRGESPIAISKILKIAVKQVTRALSYADPLLTERKLTPLKSGYLCVSLRNIDGETKTENVHVLIATAFHGPRPSTDLVVLHLDGSRTNNKKDNLAWGTRSENTEQFLVHKRAQSVDWIEMQNELRNNQLVNSKHELESSKVSRRKALLAQGAIAIPNYDDYFLWFNEKHLPMIYSVKNRETKSLKTHISPKTGHVEVTLFGKAGRRTEQLHRLVQLSIKGPAPSDKPYVRHLDGNPQNNCPNNLAFGSGIENARDAQKHSKKNKTVKFKHNKDDILEIFELAAFTEKSVTQIAKLKKTSKQNVSSIISRKSFTEVPIEQSIVEKAQLKLGSTPRKLKAGQADEIRNAFALGDTTAPRLAEELGYSHSAVIGALRRSDRKDIKTTAHLQSIIDGHLELSKTLPRRKITKMEDLHLIHEMRRNGIPVKIIANTFGLGESKIYAILRGDSYKMWQPEKSRK